jgi:PEP-CTERM motif-containing protein
MSCNSKRFQVLLISFGWHADCIVERLQAARVVSHCGGGEMKFKTNIFGLVILTSVFALTPLPALADTCDTTPGNVIANCGFENGTQAATPTVPNSWTANAAYLSEPTFNFVTSSPSRVFQGSFALSIGNFDTQPVPQLSQTFVDISGATYSGTLFVNYGGAGVGDSGAFFETLIDGTAVVTLNDTAPGVYTEYTFSFTGTGSDTITLEGNTNPSEWFVDDITVTPTVGSTTPEPGTLALVGTGILSLARMLRRRGLWKVSQA